MFDNDEVIISSGNIIQRKYDANAFPKGVRVTVPEFEIFSNPIIRIDNVKLRKYLIAWMTGKPQDDSDV